VPRLRRALRLGRRDPLHLHGLHALRARRDAGLRGGGHPRGAIGLKLRALPAWVDSSRQWRRFFARATCLAAIDRPRALGLLAGAQEVVARTHRARAGAVRRPGRPDPGLGGWAPPLHRSLLTPPPPPPPPPPPRPRPG